MAERIDVLIQKELVAGISDTRQFFTVNSLGVAVDVPLNAMAGGNQGDLLPEYLPNYKFAPKENINLLSLGVAFPYNFVPSVRTIYAKLYWVDAAGVGPLNVGTTNVIEIPFANFELSIGAYVPWPTPRSNPYWLRMLIGADPDPAISRVRVSMIGAPLLLNAAILPITSFVKVAHNLAFVV